MSVRISDVDADDLKHLSHGNHYYICNLSRSFKEKTVAAAVDAEDGV